MANKISVLIICSVLVATAACADDYDNSRNTQSNVIIPPGMELIQKDGINIVVPKGGRINTVNGVSTIESADEYAARNFQDTEKRIGSLERSVEDLKKELSSVRREIAAMKQADTAGQN